MIAFRNLEPRRLVSPDGKQVELDPKQAAHRLVLNDGMTQKNMTLGGAGISVNSLWLVHDALETGALKQVLADYRIADQPALWLIYPKSNVVSAKVRVFMDFLIKHIGRAPVWAEG